MKPDAVKHAMYFGLLLGVLFSVNFLTQTSTNVVINSLQFVFICLIPYVVFSMMRHCRENVFEGTITYSQSFFYGLQLFFYASVVSASLKYFYFKFINPLYLKNLRSASLKILEELNYPMTEDFVTAADKVFLPLNMSLQYIWTNMFLGMFLLLILSAFLKKKQSE